MKKARFSRRAFLAAAGLSAAALGGYASLVEARWLDVGRHEIPSGDAAQPIKLLHISDLHASWSVSLDYINESLQRGLSLQPDLICITGDFITTKFDDADGYAKILAQLPAAAPTFASLGNHDGGWWAGRHRGHRTTEWTRALLKAAKIELLHNRTLDHAVKNRTIRLVGLGDAYAGECLPQLAFNPSAPAPRPFTIALSHNPDTKEKLRRYPWDLMLCGHTHGGQLYLPIIGAPFVPVVDRRFVAGLYEWENRHLHITKGVGNLWGLRFNCRPEVSLLTLA